MGELQLTTYTSCRHVYFYYNGSMLRLLTLKLTGELASSGKTRNSWDFFSALLCCMHLFVQFCIGFISALRFLKLDSRVVFILLSQFQYLKANLGTQNLGADPEWWNGVACAILALHIVSFIA